MAALYLFWPGLSVKPPEEPQNTITFENYGDPQNAKLNVVSIAPVMTPHDYASALHFKAKMNAYFDEAKEKGWLNENTIVLLPAHIATPLLMVGHKSRVYNADSFKAALTPIISRNFADFTKNYYIFDAKKPIFAAAIRAQTEIAASTYQIIFSSIAQNYGVTIVAGSLILMTPGLYPEGITYGHGPLFHSSFVFGPDGKVQQDAVRQVEPNLIEQDYVKTSLAEFLPIFEVNTVKYGVAVGADAFNADVISFYKNAGVTLLLSPQFHTENGNSINTPFGTAPNIQWAAAASMGGYGWGIEAQGSTAYIASGDYVVSQTGQGNAIIQNLWITP